MQSREPALIACSTTDSAKLSQSSPRRFAHDELAIDLKKSFGATGEWFDILGEFQRGRFVSLAQSLG